MFVQRGRGFTSRAGRAPSPHSIGAETSAGGPIGPVNHRAAELLPSSSRVRLASSPRRTNNPVRPARLEPPLLHMLRIILPTLDLEFGAIPAATDGAAPPGSGAVASIQPRGRAPGLALLSSQIPCD